MMPDWGWICGGICFGAFLLAVLLYVYILFSDRRERRFYRTNATPMIGWIVQANSRLYSAEGGWDSPAQILLAFDKDLGVLDFEMAMMAGRVAELKGTEPDEPLLAEVANLVNDEGYKPFLRFQLPLGFTGGREVYSFHVWVERKFLPEGRLQHPFVRCLVLKDRPEKRVVMDEYLPEDQIREPS